MDLRFTAKELAFRDEVRAFIRAELPADIHRKMVRGQVLEKQDIVRWQGILDKKGWAVPHWPAEWGGTGWDTVQQYLFKEEMYAALAPEAFAVNVGLIGPVLIAYGTQQQKEFFLPKIASLDIWFCQGFSEPGAGSDLASLQTRAVLDGDHYIISGQKIWTSWAHYADWMFCLVRTDREAKSQKGISYLLIDMNTPGITVRPIITIDGCHHTNEVFFDDVRVPVSNRIGEENRGWDYAKFLLGNERLTIARIGLAKARLREAWALAERVQDGDGTLAEQPRFREKSAAIEAELLALEITNLRLLDEARRNPGARQDPTASMLKLKGSDLQQAAQELLLEIAGPHALPRQTDYFFGADVPIVGPEWAATLAPRYLFGRAATIYGGTSEVQRNILAKSVLGL